jgi:hypothetical protein
MGASQLMAISLGAIQLPDSSTACRMTLSTSAFMPAVQPSTLHAHTHLGMALSAAMPGINNGVASMHCHTTSSDDPVVPKPVGNSYCCSSQGTESPTMYARSTTDTNATNTPAQCTPIQAALHEPSEQHNQLQQNSTQRAHIQANNKHQPTTRKMGSSWQTGHSHLCLHQAGSLLTAAHVNHFQVVHVLL